MFSKSCEYAIRASIYITAKSIADQRVGIKEIYRCIEAPESFTGKILQLLTNANIISSVKGPNGGFFVTETQKNISLIEIVSLMDGESLFEGCGLGLKSCSEEMPCPLHEEFKQIRSLVKNMLVNNTLSSLAGDLIGRKTFFLREFNIDLNKNCSDRFQNVKI